jgi:predicted CoA-binding protein
MVLIIGASTNIKRYSYMATERLLDADFEVYLLAKREGEVFGQKIQTQMPKSETIDTVTLYVGPAHQDEYFDKLLELAPRRVIFNPGTENLALQLLLEQNGIEVEQNCTLVMLSLKHF